MDDTDNTDIPDETQWLVDLATYIDDDVRDEMLKNYQQATRKIDGAVAQATHHAKDALQCQRGCSSCCAAGLSVLPVEAVGILQAFLRGDFVWSAEQKQILRWCWNELSQRIVQMYQRIAYFSTVRVLV